MFVDKQTIWGVLEREHPKDLEKRVISACFWGLPPPNTPRMCIGWAGQSCMPTILPVQVVTEYGRFCSGVPLGIDQRSILSSPNW